MTESAVPFIGTAGWRHTHWRDCFYPQRLPQHAWLDHYGRHFNAVELDGARLDVLDANLAATWTSAVPSDFSFSVQAPRLVTHVQKLRNCSAAIAGFLGQLEKLDGKLGPVLFNLPNRWHCNLNRLEQFLDSLPAGFRYAFEFNDHDWLREDTYALLRSRQAALCVNDRMPLDQIDTITSDFVYVRLYGPLSGGRYNTIALRAWATRVATWRRHQMKSYVLFQNDLKANAARNAALLRNFEGLRTAAGT